MTIKNISIFVLISITLIFFTGCQETQISEPDISEDMINQEGYPPDGGYPSPIINESTLEGYPITEYVPPTAPTLSPDPALGIVTGQILHQGKPVVGYSVYLANVLVNNQGQETTASLKRSSSPQAVLDINGNFVFNEITPDRYALMLFDGVTSYLLLKPQQADEEAILIDVTAGKQIDLGTLDFIDFPVE